jgi:hypothetical protein
MESSKFSPTSLSEMKTDDDKNSYCPQPTRVDHGREEFAKILPSTVRRFNFQGRNGQMASSDRCYYDWARLPVTQSSNGHHDVGGPLILGVRIITPKLRCSSLPDRARLSVTQCSNG